LAILLTVTPTLQSPARAQMNVVEPRVTVPTTLWIFVCL
jgi:hypothetical protein